MNVTSVEAASAETCLVTPADRRIYWFTLPIVAIGIVTAWLFCHFTAEDAYITARYAENLVDTGEFVYNKGERVSAMTSPLHALLESGLYLVTGRTLLSYKIVATCLYLGSVLLVAARFRMEPYPLVVCLLLLVAAPCNWEWTFGGLETPLLMFWVTLGTILAITPEKLSASRVCTIAFIAGMGFVTRYDSVLYWIPLSLYAANKSRSPKAIAMAVVCGAALPLAWLAFSKWYYGDILPTPAYVKTLKGGTYFLKLNAVYVAEYLFQLGIVPLVLLLFFVSKRKRNFVGDLKPCLKSYWGVWLGIGMLLLYGVGIATTHMMFAFRYFLPYLPATALLLAELFRREIAILSEQNQMGRLRWAFVVLMPILLVYTGIQTRHTYLYSVDGLIYPIGDRIIGEYKDEGLRHYSQVFMPLLEQQAYAIQADWRTRPESQHRSLRLHTYIGGIVPYILRDAHIYEQLVEYRHVGRYNTRVSADYIQMLVPRLGRLEKQLPGPVENYQVIRDDHVMFDDAKQHFYVYYNPHPEKNRLPSRVDGKE
jgi:arabinofuranosyltransferase